MRQIVNLNPQLSRVEAELSARIWAVFGCFPDLCGFSLQDRTGLPDYIDASSLRDDLFVTELGFSTPVSETEYDEAYKLISEAVAEITSVVVLDPDVAKRFKNSTAVNEALRSLSPADGPTRTRRSARTRRQTSRR